MQAKKDVKAIEDALWDQYYRTDRSEAARNQIMTHYHYLVIYAADRMKAKLPEEVLHDDLVSSGLFGLMDAIAAFKIELGVKFQTYSAARIRGSMLDEIRNMDWVPRLVRSRTFTLNKAKKELTDKLGSEPTNDELAAYLNMSKEAFEKVRKDSKPTGVVSLSRKYFETDSSKDVREIDILADNTIIKPIDIAAKRDIFNRMCTGFNGVEKVIIYLLYAEDMTMREVGHTVELSESRISQMHTSIIARLKSTRDPAEDWLSA